jgi:threonylcarbamoyladenosine tRNA methylthiotransferase CDKAL1
VKKACLALVRGCPRAQVDLARFFDYFERNGFVITDSLEEADVILVTACAFDAETEHEGIRLIKVANSRRRPVSELLVSGCLGGICDERLGNELNVRLLPETDGHALDDIIQAHIRFADVPDPNVLEPYAKKAAACFSEEERHANDRRWKRLVRRFAIRSGVRSLLIALGWKQDLSRLFGGHPMCSIRVARGCMGECTYCAIRFSAGPLRSKPLDDVLAEFDSGLHRGFTEFKIIAGDSGAFGQDLGTNIVELLTEIMRRQAEFRLSVLDFNIKWLLAYRAELVRLFSENQRRIRFLSFPIESGSERIIQLMNRGHSAGDARDVLRTLRSAAPALFLETQVIVGFPGETEQDYEDTVQLLRAVGFDRVDIYDYSDRPKTVASTMPDKVPPDIIRRRSIRLRREFVGRLASLEYAAGRWGSRHMS